MANEGLSLRKAEKPYVYERLSQDDAALLVVDLQVGLSSAVRDWEATIFRNNVLAHAYLGKMFKLPVVLTTSAETGPNGPLPKEILEMHPDAPYIKRSGEVNAWDNKEFRAAVKATGKSQLILAGITTDVCAAFLALSLKEAGYHVVVNADACGTFNERIAQFATQRMMTAGVQVMNLFSVNAELFRDWRNPDPNAAQEIQFLDSYIASETFAIRSHATAVKRGELVPGEDELIEVDTNPAQV